MRFYVICDMWCIWIGITAELKQKYDNYIGILTDKTETLQQQLKLAVQANEEQRVMTPSLMTLIR